MSGSMLVNTPLEMNVKQTVDYDEHVGNTSDSLLIDVTSYQKLVGKLLYLTITNLILSLQYKC